MTAQEAIKELDAIRQYCAAKALPAVDYAIQVLQEKAQQEEES